MKQELRIFLNFIFIAFLFLYSAPSFAFSPTTTHAGLSEQIVEFYNLSFDKKLNNQQKELIIQGSIDEDIPAIRALNHFYDPIRNMGINNGRSAKEWALNGAIETNDYSWPKIIQYYAQGDERKALLGLGHILHLIEDMAVPDHTRNDPHVGEGPIGLYTGESPFEDWAKGTKKRSTLQGLAQQYFESGNIARTFSNLGEYFDFTANYSNRNFFSDDTIVGNKYANFRYNNPKVIETDSRYGYWTDKINEEKFKVIIIIRERNGAVKLSLEAEDDVSVLEEYFSRLSKQAIVNGAGVIDLFFKEAEKAKEEFVLRKKQEQERAVQEAIALNNSLSSKNIFGRMALGFSFLVREYAQQPAKSAVGAVTKAGVVTAQSASHIGSIGTFSVKLVANIAKISVEEKVEKVSEKVQQTTAESRTFIQQNPQLLTAGLPVLKLPESQSDVSAETNQSRPVAQEVAEEPTALEIPRAEFQPEPVSPKEELPTPLPVEVPAVTPTDPQTPPVSPVPVAPSVLDFAVSSGGSASPPTDESGLVAWPPPTPTITLNNGLNFATSTSSQSLSGTKSEGVTIAVNNSSASVAYPSSTIWSKEITLAEGLNTFAVKAKSSNAESSEVTIQITLDSTPPAVPQITSYANNQILNTATVALGGTSEASSTIAIIQGTTSLEQTQTDGSGNWQKSVTFASGANNFQITAQDAVGNKSPALNFILYLSNYQSLSVVINEIAWAGTQASANDEWIEFYNTASSTVDLTGWTLAANDGTPAITLSATIPAYGFYLLERTADITVSDVAAHQIYTGALNNEGEHLKLLDPNGAPIDEVKASSGWFGGLNQEVGGVWQRISMERINPNQSGGVSNWGTNNQIKINGKDAGNNNILGTPKRANSLYVPISSAAITDLSVSVGSTSATLTWTAPSDADALNSQLTYDIRYSTQNLTSDSAWQAATQATSTPAVLNAGQSQTFAISGFVGGQTYYFAIKTFDQENNYSALSNVASAATPQVVVYEQNFNSLNTTYLDAQDSWVSPFPYGGEPWSVVEDQPYEGAKSVRIGSRQASASRTISSTPRALISASMRRNPAGPGQYYFYLKDNDTTLGYVLLNWQGQIVIANGASATDPNYGNIIQSYSSDVWYVVEMETYSPKRLYRARVNGGAWTPWKNFLNYNSGNLNKVEFYYTSGNMFNDWAQFDALSIRKIDDSEPTPPAPSPVYGFILQQLSTSMSNSLCNDSTATKTFKTLSGGTYKVDKIKLHLSNDGYERRPFVKIYPTNPDGTPNTSNPPLGQSSVTTVPPNWSKQWFDFNFSNPATLQPNVLYAFILAQENTPDQSSYSCPNYLSYSHYYNDLSFDMYAWYDPYWWP